MFFSLKQILKPLLALDLLGELNRLLMLWVDYVYFHSLPLLEKLDCKRFELFKPNRVYPFPQQFF